MALYLENYGLQFLAEKEDVYSGFIGYLVREGKEINGYYNAPYYFKSTGDSEFWVRTEKSENGKIIVSGLDVHCGGNCVWEVIHSGIDITPKDILKHERIVIVNNKDSNGGMIPVHIITADVLPSFLEGDSFKLQMIAQPLEINYYSDEDEFEEDQPVDKNGKKWMIAKGSLFAAGFLNNHSPEQYEEGKEYESDSFVNFTATVKKLYYGTFNLDGNEQDTFIRCIAETQYGELEFDHTFEQIPESMRKNVKVGAIISGVCILSGDAAILEYENGAIKDFDHDLRLFRYVLSGENAERLRTVLSESASYYTDTSGKTFNGPDSIINKINDVHSQTKYYAHLATIVEADKTEFEVGTRCIVLASEDKDNYESIAFITVDKNGLIDRIKISQDSRYKFELDKPETVSTPLDDIIIAESVINLIISKAKYHGLISNDLNPEEIINDIQDYNYLDKNAKRMFDALREDNQADFDKSLKNIFGYLFAKAMEQVINRNKDNPDNKTILAASYSFKDAINGKISFNVSDEHISGLERAFEFGKLFYDDFDFYVKMHNSGADEIESIFREAAVIAQKIGQLSINYFTSL